MAEVTKGGGGPRNVGVVDGDVVAHVIEYKKVSLMAKTPEINALDTSFTVFSDGAYVIPARKTVYIPTGIQYNGHSASLGLLITSSAWAVARGLGVQSCIADSMADGGLGIYVTNLYDTDVKLDRGDPVASATYIRTHRPIFLDVSQPLAQV